MSGKILLHVCCAPCAVGAFEALTKEGFEVRGHFYNPNIHPLIEFRRRLKAVKILRDRMKLDIDCDENYGLREFLRAAVSKEDERCPICYSLRLRQTCVKARELGIGLVTTTLLGSPHQDVELIARVGVDSAKEHGVEFLNTDLRPYHEAGHEKAKAMKLYLQQYCGCIYSEYERYKDTRLHLYKGNER